MDKSKKASNKLLALGIVFALMAGIATYFVLSPFTSKVPIYVAKNDIAKGDPLKKENLQIVRIAKGGVPKDAIDINADLSELISAKDMFPGDILRRSGVTNLKHDNPSILSARLKAINDNKKEDLVAGEIPVDSIQGMLDGMKPGDSVYLISVIKQQGQANTPQTPQNILTEGNKIVDNAIVIGVKGTDANNSKSALVVAVNKDDAVKIATAREEGKVYAFLLPFGANGNSSASK